jgi:hypothetical protein
MNVFTVYPADIHKKENSREFSFQKGNQKEYYNNIQVSICLLAGYRRIFIFYAKCFYFAAKIFSGYFK